MVTISENDIEDTLWKTIYDRLDTNVTDVTASVKYTDGTYVHPIKSITSSFTDKEKTQKSDYPCIVIEPIRLGEEEYTFKKKFRTVRISINVFSTASEVADKYLGKIRNSIETYRSDLRDLGVRDVKLDSTDDDAFMDRGGIKLHSRTVIYTGRFIYNSTQVY
jgi:hypothetical protein